VSGVVDREYVHRVGRVPGNDYTGGVHRVPDRVSTVRGQVSLIFVWF